MSPGPQKQFDRTEVLERAMDLFWSRGFNSTGVSELMSHMGVGRQSLYDTFGGKQQLFEEALNHYFRTHMGPVMAQLRAPGSPMNNLETIFEMWIQESKNQGFRGCLVGRTIADLDAGPGDALLRERAAAYMEVMTEAFTDLARRGQLAGEFTNRRTAEEIGGLLVTLTQGAAVISKVSPDQAEAVMRSILELVKAEPD